MSVGAVDLREVAGNTLHDRLSGKILLQLAAAVLAPGRTDHGEAFQQMAGMIGIAAARRNQRARHQAERIGVRGHQRRIARRTRGIAGQIGGEKQEEVLARRADNLAGYPPQAEWAGVFVSSSK